MQIFPAAGKVWLKYMREHIRWDAEAIIRYHKTNRTFADTDFNVDCFEFCVRIGKSNRIGKKAGQNNDQFIRIKIQVNLLRGKMKTQLNSNTSNHHLKMFEQVLKIRIERNQFEISFCQTI